MKISTIKSNDNMVSGIFFLKLNWNSYKTLFCKKNIKFVIHYFSKRLIYDVSYGNATACRMLSLEKTYIKHLFVVFFEVNCIGTFCSIFFMIICMVNIIFGGLFLVNLVVFLVVEWLW